MRVRLIAVLLSVIGLGIFSATASAVGNPPTLTPPPTPTATSGSMLQGVDCPTDTNCVAVGSGFTSGNHRTSLIETWDGTSWTSTEHGLFASMRPATLSGVSCADAGDCVAVGEGRTGAPSGHPGARTVPIAMSETDGTWTVSRPVITAAKLTVDLLDRIDCPAAGDCEAIGTGTDNGKGVTVVEQLSGGHWRIAAVAELPTATETTPASIGCSSASACLVTESGQDVAKGQAGEVSGLLSLSGGKWHQTPLGKGASEQAGSVSCPTGGACFATAYDASTGKLSEVSATGTTTSLPSPAALGNEAVPIAGLDCPAQNQCFGLAQAGETISNHRITSQGTTVAEIYDGTAFQTVFTGLPLTLRQVTCRPSFCMFVGGHDRSAAAAIWMWPTTTTQSLPALSRR